MIESATRQAKKSTFHRARIGAVICKGKRVLSTGINQTEHGSAEIKPRFKRWESTLHAEADAISKLLHKRRLDDLAGSTIYVTRVLRNGDLGISKPCKHCRDLIESVGIRRIIYSNELGEIITEKL
jgi:deoxycytidylate deaminase